MSRLQRISMMQVRKPHLARRSSIYSCVSCVTHWPAAELPPRSADASGGSPGGLEGSVVSGIGAHMKQRPRHFFPLQCLGALCSTIAQDASHDSSTLQSPDALCSAIVLVAISWHFGLYDRAGRVPRLVHFAISWRFVLCDRPRSNILASQGTGSKLPLNFFVSS